MTGFERPPTFPDFGDCPTSTAEPDVQWRAVITNGGQARSFSRVMPAFKDLLTARQIDQVIDYCNSWQDRRHDLPYDTDGLVIKVNDFKQRRRLGVTSKSACRAQP